MDYLPYRQTNHGVTILYHHHQCRLGSDKNFVLKLAISGKGGLKIYSLVGNMKNDLVKYFIQHIQNGLIIDLINS